MLNGSKAEKFGVFSEFYPRKSSLVLISGYFSGSQTKVENVLSVLSTFN
jgi:hypothetical protein